MSSPCQLLAMSVAIAALLFAGVAGSLAQDKPVAPNAPSAEIKSDTAAPGGGKLTDLAGEEVTLATQTIVFYKGSATWNTAFASIVDGFKRVDKFLSEAGVKPSGEPMTIYTTTNDQTFEFEAAMPIASPPKNPIDGDLAIGQTPAGRAFKFIHRGSYDSIDATYQAITKFLVAKDIDAKGQFLEQYSTDPLTTPQDKLVVEIYVPVE
jgi:effector-binding domain-containing protein